MNTVGHVFVAIAGSLAAVSAALVLGWRAIVVAVILTFLLLTLVFSLLSGWAAYAVVLSAGLSWSWWVRRRRKAKSTR
jgi:ABC-type iron transport system FetAB permease component